MTDKFNQDAQRIIGGAENFAYNMCSSETNTLHLLCSMLSVNSTIQKILSGYGINNEDIYEYTDDKYHGDSEPFFIAYDKEMRGILDKLMSENTNEISLNALCIGILQEDCKATRFLKKNKVDTDQIIQKLKDEREPFVIKGCESFAIPIEPTKEKIILGRDNEIKKILIGLCCNEKSNICLLGNAGVGKTAIIEELARVLENDPPEKLKDYHVVSFDTTGAIAGTKYRGEFEENINNLIKGIKDRKVIIFIDEAHVVSKLGQTEGSPSMSELLKPLLARNNYKFILSTTKEEYEMSIAKNKAFVRRFRNIFVEEPSIEDLPKIIKKKTEIYSKYHNVSISNEEIKEVIYLSKDIPNRYFPDKALDVIDYTMSYCEINKDKNFNMKIAESYINSYLGKETILKKVLIN